MGWGRKGEGEGGGRQTDRQTEEGVRMRLNLKRIGNINMCSVNSDQHVNPMFALKLRESLPWLIQKSLENLMSDIYLLRILEKISLFRRP